MLLKLLKILCYESYSLLDTATYPVTLFLLMEELLK